MKLEPTLLNPTHACAGVFLHDLADVKPPRFLGSAALVVDDALHFLTAAHIFDDVLDDEDRCPDETGLLLVLLIKDDPGVILQRKVQVDRVARHGRADLAGGTLMVDESTDVRGFVVPDEWYAASDVLSMDFSPTRRTTTGTTICSPTSARAM